MALSAFLARLAHIVFISSIQTEMQSVKGREIFFVMRAFAISRYHVPFTNWGLKIRTLHAIIRKHCSYLSVDRSCFLLLHTQNRLDVSNMDKKITRRHNRTEILKFWSIRYVSEERVSCFIYFWREQCLPPSIDDPTYHHPSIISTV